MIRSLVLCLIGISIVWGFGTQTSACYSQLQNRYQNYTTTTTTNANCNWYGSTCCNSTLDLDTGLFQVPLGSCAWGFLGNFSKSTAAVDWNVSVIYMANFSTPCQQQLRLFFYGMFCSVKWDIYRNINETDLLAERVDVVSMHVCSRMINNLWVACSSEFVPGALASNPDAYNPDVGVQACANFTEVFPTAVDLLAWFSSYSPLTGPFVPPQLWSSPFSNATYVVPSTNTTVVRPADPLANITLPENVYFNPFFYPLFYDLASTDTCFAAATSLQVPLSIVLMMFFLLGLSVF